ncbi:Motility protein B [Salinisphaera shabanensis E1L3A]|uniref:Motility protein B n=1 Tax=Salinisphaera shabanensis E1L3A TaxID=1033802 RepID=F7Q865_9GAMM|nr:flagellar motor protein MotB [Salinisphaera shabanensis]ERJ19047.1 Motility protein B [Salinisphaera shabanensis E1L3A]
MSDPNRRPIVIRRKKAASHATHGAWKIAYADFMTAMMAFFLVMWLLSGLSSAELKEMSEYFRTPLKVAIMGGDKASASNSAIPGGGDDPMHSEGEVSLTTPNATNYRPSHRPLRDLQSGLESMIKSDPRLDDVSSQLSFKVVEDGLLIQISDTKQRPMFALGSSELAPYISALLYKIAPKLNEFPNPITLTGHTDDLRFASGDHRYSNWELSADRANSARRALIKGGMQADKLLRVIGAAATASRPGVESSAAPANRRISILVLNEHAQMRIEDESAAPPQALSADADTHSGANERMVKVDANEPPADAKSG